MKRSDGKWYFTTVKKTIYRFQMIEEGDSVVVALSGGKDSCVLLFVLDQFRRKTPATFSLQAVYVNLGWPVELTGLKQYAKKLNVPFHVEETAIARIVFERRQEKNPCALCANLRRGALNQAALRLGANKVALGHHLDDAIETMMMNLFFTGRFDTFKPKTFLDRTGLTVIRPLILLPGRTVAALAEREKLPVFQNPCPASGRTRRGEMAELLKQLGARYPDLREKCRSALLASYWQDGHN